MFGMEVVNYDGILGSIMCNGGNLTLERDTRSYPSFLVIAVDIQTLLQ
jgi:hypothetical protein